MTTLKPTRNERWVQVPIPTGAIPTSAITTRTIPTSVLPKSARTTNVMPGFHHSAAALSFFLCRIAVAVVVANGI